MLPSLDFIYYERILKNLQSNSSAFHFFQRDDDSDRMEMKLFSRSSYHGNVLKDLKRIHPGVKRIRKVSTGLNRRLDVYFWFDEYFERFDHECV